MQKRAYARPDGTLGERWVRRGPGAGIARASVSIYAPSGGDALRCGGAKTPRRRSH